MFQIRGSLGAYDNDYHGGTTPGPESGGGGYPTAPTRSSIFVGTYQPAGGVYTAPPSTAPPLVLPPSMPPPLPLPPPPPAPDVPQSAPPVITTPLDTPTAGTNVNLHTPVGAYAAGLIPRSPVGRGIFWGLLLAGGIGLVLLIARR